MEYISKQSLLADLNEATPRSYFAFETMVREYPTEDVVPVIHAHWILKEEVDSFGDHYRTYIICSKCNHLTFKTWNFCPYCGALMDEDSI